MIEHVRREIWLKATDLLVPVYAMTSRFPKDELQSQINQLRAATVGIVVSLAEGFGAESEIDVERFIKSSLRAAHDCVAGLEVVRRLGLCPAHEAEDLIAHAQEIVGMLTGMVNNPGNPAQSL
ncbi:MAG: four helix bundle protein [Anaerolineae bacterium]